MMSENAEALIARLLAGPRKPLNAGDVYRVDIPVEIEDGPDGLSQTTMEPISFRLSHRPIPLTHGERE